MAWCCPAQQNASSPIKVNYIAWKHNHIQRTNNGVWTLNMMSKEAFIVIWFDKTRTLLLLTKFRANSVDLELGFPWLWPATPLKQTLSQGFGVWQNRIQKFIASNYIACSVYCHRYEIKHVQVKVNGMIKHNDTETIFLVEWNHET